MSKKLPALKDPALLEILNFFKPSPKEDFGFRYRSLEMTDLVSGLQRSKELREHIKRLMPCPGRTGNSVREAQDMCKMIEAGLAAKEALRDV